MLLMEVANVTMQYMTGSWIFNVTIRWHYVFCLLHDIGVNIIFFMFIF